MWIVLCCRRPECLLCGLRSCGGRQFILCEKGFIHGSETSSGVNRTFTRSFGCRASTVGVAAALLILNASAAARFHADAFFACAWRTICVRHAKSRRSHAFLLSRCLWAHTSESSFFMPCSIIPTHGHLQTSISPFLLHIVCVVKQFSPPPMRPFGEACAATDCFPCILQSSSIATGPSALSLRTHCFRLRSSVPSRLHCASVRWHTYGLCVVRVVRTTMARAASPAVTSHRGRCGVARYLLRVRALDTPASAHWAFWLCASTGSIPALQSVRGW